MKKHRFTYEKIHGYSTLNILGSKPLMTEKETDMIQSYLKPHHVMFEWGSGGSTLYFPKFVKKYYSIEHQLHWYRHIRNNLRKDNEINKKVNLKYIPCDMEYYFEEKIPKREWFSTYIESIGNINEKIFDIILIDGEKRTRGFCAEEATKYMNNESILFIHDYYKRLNISWIEKYYNIIDSIKDGETLVVMRKN